MSKFLISTLALTALVACNNKNKKDNNIVYPETRKDSTVYDTYFGEKIADPYRWLEDDRSEETTQWVKDENELTFNYLKKIPYREKLKNSLKDKWNYEKIGAPFTEGDYTYFFKNNGLQNQSVLYRKNKNGVEEVFLDPNSFSEDGTTSLATISFSKDGSLMGYAISEGGSDWNKILILKTDDKTTIDKTLENVKFSGIAWFNNEGFFYSSYDKPDGSELSAKTDQHKLYYHKLGTDQSEDVVVFGNDIKRRYVSASVTEDQKYLVISTANTTYGNELYIKDLTDPSSKIIPLVTGFDNEYSLIDEKDDALYILTNRNAPNSQLMKADKEVWKNFSKWKTIIPETENVLNVTKAGNYLFARYMKDALSLVEQFDYNGNKVRTIELPDNGTASGFSDKSTVEDVYYSFTNYITPPSIYKLNIESGKSEIYKQPKVKFNPSDFVSESHFYTSKDGTKIPITITYKKGIKRDGTNPTILYAYGGFNISLTPSFNIANAVWLENGGIYAVPNLRGGGEYGKEWHDAGTKMQKQNVFNDFIAAAEYLIKENYTSPSKLAIKGGSNGGLLVGATLTQRPDLMKVALPAVGVLDMLRYHKFTAGAGWAYDYGTSDDSKEMFEYLKGYSPLHNVKSGVNYPATLITTGDHDDRVVPAHSFKFAAELQEKNLGENPILIRIGVNAGHGAGKSVEQTIEENADIQAFTLWNMGIKKLK